MIKSVRLCGRNIAVNEVDVIDLDIDDVETYLGLAKYRDCEIEIKRDAAEESKKNTVVHEIVHFIFSLCNIINTDTVERIVNRVSNSIVALIRNNRNFIDFMYGLKKIPSSLIIDGGKYSLSTTKDAKPWSHWQGETMKIILSASAKNDTARHLLCSVVSQIIMYGANEEHAIDSDGIDFFGLMLFALIIDNKKLIKWIQEK